MANVNPLLLVGAVIGVVTALLVLAYALVKDKKETMDFERTMNDGDSAPPGRVRQAVPGEIRRCAVFNAVLHCL